MQVSVIIPVLNEAAIIPDAIMAAWAAGADEVIVADGGSSDESAGQVEPHGARLVLSEPGRGTQQNQAAQVASGEILLFLHADSCLAPDAINQIRDAVSKDKCCWGAFHHKINAPGRIYRWIEAGNLWRARRRQLVYGDQGIWVERETLRRVGGFPDVPLMEDVLLSYQLRKEMRPRILPGPLSVSARRWQARGPIRQTLKNWMIISLFRIGIPVHTLNKLY